MKNNSINNFENEEIKGEDEKKIEKKIDKQITEVKDEINENKDNEQEIQAEASNINPEQNTKKLEKEATDINLRNSNIGKPLGIGEQINEENNNIYYEKQEIKQAQEIIIIEQRAKNIENVDYSKLPKIKNGKPLTKKEMYREYLRETEDTCDKCPLRCLLFIPIFFGYCFLSLIDFLTYMIVPVGYCLFYTIIFICNYCRNIVSHYQVEEEIGFSGAFTSENEIKIHVADEGGVMHLNEILCFSYMSACVKRYFCFIFVLINHILVPILQAWKKAKDCFIKSKIEELYDERIAQIEEAKQYKGYEQVES